MGTLVERGHIRTQITSELRTKKGESSLARMSLARANGPAVPSGSVSTENVIRTLYLSSYYDVNVFNLRPYFFEGGHHNFRSVIDCEDDVCIRSEQGKFMGSVPVTPAAARLST
jgi:hypothetical protein